MNQRVLPPSSPDSGVVQPQSEKRRPIWPWLLIVAAVLVAGVVWRAPWKTAGGPQGGFPGGPPGQGMQTVAVGEVTKGDVPVVLTSLGTVTSLATVTVKSQISGYLKEIHFREGDEVKKGDLLVQIDDRPYQAALEQYQGQLERDQALLDNARLDLIRYQRLIQQDSTSKQTADTAAATVRQYEGTVRMDQGQVDSEKLNIDYCRIVSPVDGVVGLRQVDVGNYVTASDTNGVVVVVETHPISVVFTLPEDNLRQVLTRIRAGAQLSASVYDRTNTDKLADGKLDTIDNQVDTSTGTVKLRALFDNSDKGLFPNQFVNVSLLVDTLEGAVTAPSNAIQNGAPGTFVYLLNANGTVALRKIKIGPTAGGRVAVLSGLSVGDKVVVDGADRLVDGAKVSVVGDGLSKTAASP
jgi:multidrug efflux system membrane fusion protein